MNVLVVDDSAAIRKILTRVLSQADLKIEKIMEAENGIAALELLKAETVDLLLSDVNMPKMNGFELVKTIRNTDAWKKLPIIMITTEGSQEKVSEAVNTGVNGFVRKPFTPDQIREKVLRCLPSASV